MTVKLLYANLIILITLIGVFSFGCLVVGSNPIEAGDYAFEHVYASMFPSSNTQPVDYAGSGGGGVGVKPVNTPPVPDQIDYSTIPQHVPYYDYVTWNTSEFTLQNASDETAFPAIYHYGGGGGGVTVGGNDGHIGNEANKNQSYNITNVYEEDLYGTPFNWTPPDGVIDINFILVTNSLQTNYTASGGGIPGNWREINSDHWCNRERAFNPRGIQFPCDYYVGYLNGILPLGFGLRWNVI